MQKHVTKIIMLQRLFLILLLFSLFGCSTIAARSGKYPDMTEGKLYPATKFDVYLIKSNSGFRDLCINASHCTAMGIVDLGSSALVDTLLLPYDLFKKHKKPKN